MLFCMVCGVVFAVFALLMERFFCWIYKESTSAEWNGRFWMRANIFQFYYSVCLVFGIGMVLRALISRAELNEMGILLVFFGGGFLLGSYWLANFE